ncbi:MAG: tetratricopeptide repeat protein [Treponema sp.]|jgi:tetratricopeptide (TPR) repeat protein|nr:tetratricopeptide repeat protein [Treponema sp.]
MVNKKNPADGGREARVYPLENQGGKPKAGGESSRGPFTGRPDQKPAGNTGYGALRGIGKPAGPVSPVKVPGAAPGAESLLFGAGRLREGIRLFRMKRYDIALKELAQVDGTGFSGEENAELAYYLGLCHTKLGHYEEALLYLDQVVASGKNVLRSYQCRMTLSYIYVITGKHKMAEFELMRLQKSGFESTQLYTTLAYIAWTKKNIRGALNCYERVLEMDENNTTAMNGLGYILVETNSDLVRGLRLCRRAVDRKPQNAVYMDSLGWAYFKNGDITGARTWLRKALDLTSQEKEIQDHWRVVTGEEPPRGK